MEITFCHSEVFGQHPIPYDAAGAERSHSGKGGGLVLNSCTRTLFIFAWSCYWSTFLSLRRTLLIFHFQPSLF